MANDGVVCKQMYEDYPDLLDLCSSDDEDTQPVVPLVIGGGDYRGLRLRNYHRGSSRNWDGLLIRSAEVVAVCGASGVQFVHVLAGLQQVGERAFSWCSSLTSVTFPEGLQQVGGCAFLACSSLTSVTLPQGCSYTESGVLSSFPPGCSVVVQ